MSNILEKLLTQYNTKYTFYVQDKQYTLVNDHKVFSIQFEFDQHHNIANFSFKELEHLQKWIEKNLHFSFSDIEKLIEESTYLLVGYDKDHDLYSPIDFSTNLLTMIQQGTNICNRYNEGYILLNELEEPYDWFEVIRTKDFDTVQYQPLWTSYNYEIQKQQEQKEISLY